MTRPDDMFKQRRASGLIPPAQIPNPDLRKCAAWCLIGFFIPLLLFATSLGAEPVLVINTTGKKPLNTVEMTGFMDRITAEALRRVGYRLQTVHYPAERGLRNANAGVDDGDMARIAGLSKIYPNLIQVPEKIMDWDFCVFSNKSFELKNSWASLAGQRVAFLNGWKILEKNVPRSAFITKTRSPEQLFTLLNKKRVDFVLYERWSGLQMIATHGAVQINLLQPPLETREMFLYLHKKHKALVPRITEVLRQMKNDGSYQAITDQILTPLSQ